MKEIYYQALNAKRACIRKLLEKTMSANKRMFILWAQYNRQAKQIDSCRLTVDFFAVLFNNLHSGYSPLLQNPKEAATKERVIAKLFMGLNNKLYHAFVLWKNHAVQQRMQDAFTAEKKKALVDALTNFKNGN